MRMVVSRGNVGESSDITIHFGRNPSRGGSPARERKERAIVSMEEPDIRRDILYWPVEVFEIFIIRAMILIVITM